MKSKKISEPLTPINFVQHNYVEMGAWFCKEVTSRTIGVTGDNVITEIKFVKPGVEDTYIEIRHTGDICGPEFRAGQSYVFGFAATKS